MNDTNQLIEHHSNPFEFSFACTVKHLPIKRTFDIIFSLLFLTICLPIFVLIALAIKLTSSGSIIYSQERIGRGGNPFRCYKFRTMFPDSEIRLKEILLSDATKREEWESNYKLKNDPRITWIGSILRKTSLDELPQFWNVLKGDLSVVGPRPVVKEEIVRFYGAKATTILSIRPGITGLWQVSGRSDINYETRISLDENYVDRRSLILDLKLVFLTIPKLISRRGAY